MKLIPLFDLVLIRRDPPRLKSGLIVFAGSRSNALEQRSHDGNPGTVLAVGAGGWRGRVENGKYVYRYRVPTLKPGDRILCGFRVNNAVPEEFSGDEEWCMMHEEDLQAKLEE